MTRYASVHSRVSHVITSGLSPATLRNYRSRVVEMRALGLRRNYEGLEDLLSQFRDGRSPAALSQFYYAVRWHRDLTNKRAFTWRQEKRLKRLLQGRNRMHTDSRPRGAIPWDKLCALVRWMQERGASAETLEDLLIVWGTGLRTSQVGTVTVKDFAIRPDAVVMRVDKIHDPHRNMRARARRETRYCQQHIIATLTARLRRHRDRCRTARARRSARRGFSPTPTRGSRPEPRHCTGHAVWCGTARTACAMGSRPR